MESTPHKSLTELSAALLVALLGAAYLVTIVSFSTSILIWDDYDISIRFLLDLQEENSLPQIVHLMLLPNGEHYVFFNKLLTLGSVVLKGTFDPQLLIYAGVAALVLTIALLSRWYSGSSKPSTLTSILLCLLLFTPQFFQSSLWASGAAQHLWVAPLVLSFWLCAERSTVLWQTLATFFALLATVTQGNGVLGVFAYGVAALAFERRRKGLVWILVSVFLFVVCFGHLADSSNIQNSARSLSAALGYFLTFLGAGTASGATGASWAGAFSLLVFVLLIAHRQLTSHSSVRWGRDPVVFAAVTVALWVLLTAAANAVARSELGVAYAYEQTRYRLPSLLWLSALLMLILERTRETAHRNTAIGFSVSFATILLLNGYHRSFPYLQAWREQAEESNIRWLLAGARGLSHPDSEHAARLLTAARDAGLYHLPKVDLGSVSASPYDQSNSGMEAPKKARGEIEICTYGNGLLYLSGYMFDRQRRSFTPFHPVIELTDGTASKYFQGRNRLRADVVQTFHNELLWRSGFSALVRFPSETDGAVPRGRVLALGRHGRVSALSFGSGRCRNDIGAQHHRYLRR